MSHSRVAFPLASFSPRLVAGLGVCAAVSVGIAIGHGWGMMAIGGVGVACLYGVIGLRWQWGVYGLLSYLPFAGVVTLAFFPWKGPLLFKDLLFLLPAYLGFFGRLCLRRESLRGMPWLPVGVMMALAILVLVQMANPGTKDLLMGLIGLKVWLFYLPLFLLSYTLVVSEEDLHLLLHLLVGLSFIPEIIGITQAVLSQAIGYHSIMETLYQEAAGPATQGFAQFGVGSGVISRVPSTFTFVTQYFGYTLAMLAPCYAVWRGDPSPRWRRIGGWGLVLAVLASFLSGARAAFVFVPLVLVLIFWFERGLAGLAYSAAYSVGLLFAALAVLGIGGAALYEHISELFMNYAEGVAYGGLVEAILTAPWGTGVGTNTGPARYAFTDPSSLIGIENYYAKAVYELGLPGLFLVVSLFLSLIFLGYRSHRKLKRASLRSCSAGLLAFLVTIALNSFKGWQIDLDPVNVYFWMFAGILMKLPALDSPVANKQYGTVAEPVLSLGNVLSVKAYRFVPREEP